MVVADFAVQFSSLSWIGSINCTTLIKRWLPYIWRVQSAYLSFLKTFLLLDFSKVIEKLLLSCYISMSCATEMYWQFLCYYMFCEIHVWLSWLVAVSNTWAMSWYYVEENCNNISNSLKWHFIFCLFDRNEFLAQSEKRLWHLHSVTVQNKSMNMSLLKESFFWMYHSDLITQHAFFLASFSMFPFSIFSFFVFSYTPSFQLLFIKMCSPSYKNISSSIRMRFIWRNNLWCFARLGGSSRRFSLTYNSIMFLHYGRDCFKQ